MSLPTGSRGTPAFDVERGCAGSVQGRHPPGAGLPSATSPFGLGGLPAALICTGSFGKGPPEHRLGAPKRPPPGKFRADLYPYLAGDKDVYFYLSIYIGVSKSVCLSIYLLLTRKEKKKNPLLTQLLPLHLKQKKKFFHIPPLPASAEVPGMRDGLAASVFGSTAHPPQSHSCQEGPSHPEHRDKEVTPVPTSHPPGEAEPREELAR